MKLALGLFHFNMQYVAGDIPSYHRYCTQAVIPFLKTIKANPRYRVSFEMSGSGLEFLHQNYPAAIGLLRDLVEQNQVELVSSTYAPTLWVAFPKIDLVRSIELNRTCLARLGLKASDIFFSQESFFGPGLKEIGHLFPVAICKADYLRFFARESVLQPIYRLGQLLVVVGCNHLLNELADQPQASTELSHFQKLRLQDAASFLPTSDRLLTNGVSKDVEWYWYHVGSGHHLTTWGSPPDWETFLLDTGWMRATCGVLDGLIAKGYRLAFVRELVDALHDRPIDELPTVVEGSWNPERSRGVYAWMGQHQNPWQNSPGILGLAWRSRTELRKCEEMAHGPHAVRDRPRVFTELWKQQILSESSDPLGWKPLQVEVNFGRGSAEKTLQLCAKFSLETPELTQPSEEPRAGIPINLEATNATENQAPFTAVELFGGDGAVHWTSVSSRLQVCEAEFRAATGEAGLRFERHVREVVYCPSGMESEPVLIRLESLRPAEIYLPLANGLINLGEKLYLVRINCFGQVAARVCKDEPWLEFAVRGAISGKMFRWRFLLMVCDSAMEAVDMANRANSI